MALEDAAGLREALKGSSGHWWALNCSGIRIIESSEGFGGLRRALDGAVRLSGPRDSFELIWTAWKGSGLF